MLDCKDIQKIYREITLSIKKPITTIPSIDKIQESYIGIISFAELIKLICNDDNMILKDLFYENVRDFQGDSIVNQEITKTFLDEVNCKYFGLLHNGITIIAKKLQKTGGKHYFE